MSELGRLPGRGPVTGLYSARHARPLGRARRAAPSRRSASRPMRVTIPGASEGAARAGPHWSGAGLRPSLCSPAQSGLSPPGLAWRSSRSPAAPSLCSTAPGSSGQPGRLRRPGRGRLRRRLRARGRGPRNLFLFRSASAIGGYPRPSAASPCAARAIPLPPIPLASLIPASPAGAFGRMRDRSA